MAADKSSDDESTASTSCSCDTAEAFLEMLGLPALDGLSAEDDGAENDCNKESLKIASHTACTANSSYITKFNPSITHLEVPSRCSRYLHQPKDVAAFVIDNFLDAAECQELIHLSKQLSRTGFHYVTEAAHTDSDGVTHMVKLQEPNKHKLSVFEHTPTLDKLWTKMNPVVLPNICEFIDNTSCGPPLGLNPRLRVLCYDASDNDVFDPHFDATTKVGKNTSLLTVLIYLNDGGGEDFEGGETFYLDSGVSPRGTDTAIKVIPTAGKVVVFEHDLYHSSVPLKFGTKYVLRTDILFDLDATNDGSVAKPRGDVANKKEVQNEICTTVELCDQLALSEETKQALDEIGLLDLTLDSLFAPGVVAVKQMLCGVLDGDSVELFMKAALECR